MPDPAGGVPDLASAPDPAGGLGRPAKGRVKLRKVLLGALIVLAVLCVGGLGTAYFAYDKATRPDRSTPGVVVQQFVNSTFNDRDPSEAKLYTCRSPQLGEVDAMLADFVQREGQFDTRFTVTLTNTSPRIDGDSAVVEADLLVTTSASRSFRHWRFDLVDQSGWRVCAARRLP